MAREGCPAFLFGLLLLAWRLRDEGDGVTIDSLHLKYGTLPFIGD